MVLYIFKYNFNFMVISYTTNQFGQVPVLKLQKKIFINFSKLQRCDIATIATIGQIMTNIRQKKNSFVYFVTTLDPGPTFHFIVHIK